MTAIPSNLTQAITSARMSQPAAPPPDTVPSPFFHEENALFVGIAFESIFYGITFLLYCLTIRNLFLWSSKKNSRTLWRLMGFLTIQQIALLIAVLTNIQFCVLAFVYHRDTPGGPVAYQILNSNVAPAYASLASFSVCNWFQDVVLLYRFHVIYNKWYKIFTLACMLFLTSIAFNLILLIQLSGHAGLLNVGNNLPVSTIYFSLSVGLNVILTLLIVGRIIYCARLTTTNQSKLPKRYVSVSAMIIESSALSAVTGIALIITLHTNVASSIAIESLYGAMTVLAPVLITYRVSTGDAWSRNTTEQASTMGPFVVTSAGGGSRTVLGRSGEDIILKSRDGGLESNPSHISPKDSQQEV
ncbi:hypothetical protein HYPSUDRAFT_215254 [Hypholoma sublateritium FD-334 SS-4]|uniref:G-protein coupled receptors family 1 profile domain-containing protein n=1 Tax=Hypholoma sublateritium (strain FD-334 SS-4) TaxID=945553 RepID=A0A0D2PUC5_HYPSF|nr:hypothetical protein HYPSUDRAFT_215254 [Hypholoma sublateritium FD-334 SS-4]